MPDPEKGKFVETDPAHVQFAPGIVESAAKRFPTQEALDAYLTSPEYLASLPPDEEEE